MYTWNDAKEFAANLGGNLPTAAIDARICDMVSSEIWTSYPWKRLGSTQTNIALGSFPLTDGVQDYSVPTNLFRLLSAYFRRTDTDPDQFRMIEVREYLPMDLTKRSFVSIRSVAHQAGYGVIRLESAIAIPSGADIELGGTYQTQHVKVTNLATPIWIDDQNFTLPVEGILYWLYKLADDPRAGGVEKVVNGKAFYSGQYARFRALIDRAAAEEDFGDLGGYFPGETLGASRETGAGLNIYPNA